MLAQSLAAAATLVSFAVHGSRVELKLNEGAAELGFVTQSTFRMRHSFGGALEAVKWPDRERVEVRAEDRPDAVTFFSKFLQVSIVKRGLQMRVKRHDGSPLMSDLTPAEPRPGGGVAWERAAGQSDRLYGLGARADLNFDLRGKVVQAQTPLLVSTGGYGEYHNAPGAYTFDMVAAKPDRYRIQAPAVDYYFFYGPTPKEIFEEAAFIRGVITPTPMVEVRTGSWDSLRDSVLRTVQASLSGILMPAFDMTPYANAPPALAERARQFGQIVPGLVPEKAALTNFRRQLTMFLSTYAEEARDRGYPFFHPLPFQFPEDSEVVRRADQFMLGDEMLIAPIVTPAATREVYLPRGIWTNLETNETTPGRRTITVKSKSLPIFARNGTIVPLNGLKAGDPTVLHYFPSLGAEFFLLETDLADWSQVHAAPAADIMRLQIESKVARLYEWVAHHVPKPVRIEFENRKYREVRAPGGLQDGTWYYDAAAKNLHIRVMVAAEEDSIINIIPE